jgi:hypothetical protein
LCHLGIFMMFYFVSWQLVIPLLGSYSVVYEFTKTIISNHSNQNIRFKIVLYLKALPRMLHFKCKITYALNLYQVIQKLYEIKTSLLNNFWKTF